MSTPFQAFESRITAAIDATPSRIPVVLGPCGAGRTSLLTGLRARGVGSACHYIALERVTSTPERFLAGLAAETPYEWAAAGASLLTSPLDAYTRALAYLCEARTKDGRPATFLLDEILELRTFENFPGLRHVVRDTLDRLAASDNRFVLTTRFVARALRILRDIPERFVVLHIPALTAPDVAADLLQLPGFRSDTAEDCARMIVALSDGRMAYAGALVQALTDSTDRVPDPLAAFARLLSAGGALDVRCHHSYEFRLHRARGYGALKAILGILAEDEPLTLTEIARQLQRTPGSTKDYLGWLEDVDLVISHRKRYRIADPVLRLWVGLHTRCGPPSEERVAEEVQRFAVARLAAADSPTG